jgi:hypothetical protein
LRQIFGSYHHTLIGLLSEWWVGTDPERRFALDEGPGVTPAEVGRRQADLLLCEDSRARIVVEVEHDVFRHKLDTIDFFFQSHTLDVGTPEAGLLLMYPAGFTGRRVLGAELTLPLEECVQQATAITGRNPGKAIGILAIRRIFDPEPSGPRSRSEFYAYRTVSISGVLLGNGVELSRADLLA